MHRKVRVAAVVAALVGTLLVAARPAQAAVTSVEPSSLPPGATDSELIITGSGFLSGAPTSVSFSPSDGIAIDSVTAQSSTTIRVVVDVAAAATRGFRDVTVTQGVVNQGTCNDCFSVGPRITAVGGPYSNADATTTVTILGGGFDQSASATLTKSGYGFGGSESDTVTATTVAVAETGNSATLTFSGGQSLRGRAPGFWRVTLVNPDNGAGTFGNGTTTGLQLTGPVPAITSISPDRVGAGASGRELTVTGTGLARGVTFAFAPGSGSTGSVSPSGPAAWASPTEVKVPVNVAGGTSGSFNVTATNTDAKAGTCNACLTGVPAPAVTSISPGTLGQGAGPVSLQVNGSAFQPGAVVSFSGTGISVSGTPAVTATKITATIDVAENAAIGDRDVAVTNPDGGRAQLSGALEIVGGPKVTSATPASRPQGATSDIAVAGSNFPSGLTAAEVDFGAGTTVTAVKNLSLLRDSFTATIQVAPGAAPGSRVVSVRDLNGSGVSIAKGSCACFGVAGAPTVSGVDPGQLGQGASVEAEIAGDFFQNGVTVSITGGGLTISGVTRVDQQTIRFNLAVAPDAPVGARDVRVTNPDSGTVLCPACLRVNARPVVTSVSPGSRPQGFSGTVTLDGSGFKPGIGTDGVEFSGDKITVTSVTVDSPTRLTVGVDIADNADTAVRDVTVTNPDLGTSTCNDCFRASLAPVVAVVSPDTGDGASVVTVTVGGEHFQPGAQFRLQGANGIVEATDEAVTTTADGATVTGKLDLRDVSPGPWNVRVINPDGGADTAADAFTVAVPRPTVTAVTPASIAQKSSGVSVRVTGTNFRPGFTLDVPAGNGVDVKSVTRIDQTRIDLVVDVGLIARLGDRDVTVTNTDGKVGTCAACLRVVDGDQPRVLGSQNAYGPFDGGAFSAAGDFDGDPANGDEIVTGAGFGGGPHVQLWRVSRSTGALTPVAGEMVYPVGFPGGVRVATGNFDGDLSDGYEFVTAAGPTGGPHVRVFGYDPSTNRFTTPYGTGFYAYDPAFSGGVFVGAADADGDGVDEIVIGAGQSGGPHVRIWKLDTRTNTFQPFREWMAYDGGFRAGISVAGGDLVPEGGECGNSAADEIVTGPGRGGGPHVRVWCANGRLAGEFMAGGGLGGANVGTADVNGDTIAEVVVGDGSGPKVRVFDTGDYVEIAGDTVYEPGFGGGVLVSGHDVDADGDDEVITTPGAGRPAHITIRRYQ